MSVVNNSVENLPGFQVMVLQAPANFLWFIFGLFGLICNILMIATIVGTKALHTKSQLIVLSLCISDAFGSLTFALTGLKRYVFVHLVMIDNISRIFCLLECLPLSVFPMATFTFMLEISIDRVLLFVRPLYHRTLRTTRYIVLLNVVAWSAGLGNGGLAMYTSDPEQLLPICTAVAALSPLYQVFSNAVTNAMAVGTVVFNVISLLALWHRLRIIGRMSVVVDRNEHRNHLELRTFQTMLVMALVYIIFAVALNKIVANIAPYLPLETAIRVNSYFSLALILNQAAPFVVYLILSREFRKAFLSMIRKNSAVAPSSWLS